MAATRAGSRAGLEHGSRRSPLLGYDTSFPNSSTRPQHRSDCRISPFPHDWVSHFCRLPSFRAAPLVFWFLGAGAFTSVASNELRGGVLGFWKRGSGGSIRGPVGVKRLRGAAPRMGTVITTGVSWSVLRRRRDRHGVIRTFGRQQISNMNLGRSSVSGTGYDRRRTPVPRSPPSA